jgi:3-dehydroquinate synthase
MVQRDHMPVFQVKTARHRYQNVVERGILGLLTQYEFVPQGTGKLFTITTEDVWRLHGRRIQSHFDPDKMKVLFFPGAEMNKRLASLERLAEQMVDHGADRTSMVIGFGGGIVTDISGFLAAVFMRGIPVLQIPTTLLAQVDAAIGGKTGVNLACGKNLIGSFHQPRAVLIDPDLISTLPQREYRAGLYEVIKCGIIRDLALFELLEDRVEEVRLRAPDVVDELIAAAVRIKTEVVSADERESDLRRILNFGHTIGHAIEAETEYVRFLHGEAIAWGMLAATRLAELLGLLDTGCAHRIKDLICAYGPLPDAKDLNANRLIERLASDKKTLQGKVHFVLPTAIGEVKVVSGIDSATIRRAITESLQ